MKSGFWMADEARATLRVEGPEAEPFLQDLVTNDLAKLRERALLYAALLTPQGKYLFDFLIARVAGGFLLDVAADRAAALIQRLAMYRLRRKVEIAPAGVPVALYWGGAPPEGALADPRAPALGFRLYGRPRPEGAAEASRADYDALRVAHLVPESGAELSPDETYILEAGFDRLSGVDFRKGCYVGQEVTARMKHKTELKKGLVRVAVEGVAAPGTPVTAEGKPAGVLHTTAGATGLAYLRFDRAEGEMRAGAARLRRL